MIERFRRLTYWAAVLRGGSLRRQAWSEARQLSGETWRAFLAPTIREGSHRVGKWLLHSRFSALLLPLLPIVGLAPLFDPIWTLPFNSNGENPRTLLLTLWQVQAATLALSFAVLLVVFEIAASSRGRSSVREFAVDSRLFPFLYLGVGGLILDGYVLVTADKDQLAGWPGTWAIVYSGAGIVTLGLLVVMAVQAIDERTMHLRRLERSKKEASREARQLALRNIANALLERECTNAGVELTPLLFTPAPGSMGIRPTRSGEVWDIDMTRLRRVAVASGTGNVALLVALGDDVRGDSPVMWLPQGVRSAAMRSVDLVVTVR